MTRDIHDAYNRLSNDPDFASSGGMELYRAPLGNTLRYEIHVSDFDFDLDTIEKLRAFAERESLNFEEPGQSGVAVLRLRTDVNR